MNMRWMNGAWRLLAPEGGDGGAGSAGAAPKPDGKAPAKAPEQKEAPPDKKRVKIVAKPPAKTEAKASPKPEPKPEPKPAVKAKVTTERGSKIDEIERAFEERLGALTAKLERQRERSVIATLRRLGADPDRVTDEDLLALAPKVDPDEPAGKKALLDWKAKRPGFFAATGPREKIEDTKKRLTTRGLTAEQVERRMKLAQRLGGK